MKKLIDGVWDIGELSYTEPIPDHLQLKQEVLELLNRTGIPHGPVRNTGWSTDAYTYGELVSTGLTSVGKVDTNYWHRDYLASSHFLISALCRKPFTNEGTKFADSSGCFEVEGMPWHLYLVDKNVYHSGPEFSDKPRTIIRYTFDIPEYGDLK